MSSTLAQVLVRSLKNDALWGEKKALANKQEVGKLIDANFVKEIRFQTRVANPVLVIKRKGKLRMYVDFRDLNKACPNSYPFPRIDQLVDATSGHKLLSFMDAYSGYNPIQMVEGDTHHRASYANSDIYHYTLMLFELINASAAYQRMINKFFGGMIGITMEAYVDDMFFKSIKGEYHFKYLSKTFECMYLHQVCLNPAK